MDFLDQISRSHGGVRYDQHDFTRWQAFHIKRCMPLTARAAASVSSCWTDVAINPLQLKYAQNIMHLVEMPLLNLLKMRWNNPL